MDFTYLGPQTSIYKDYILKILSNNYEIGDYIRETLWIELGEGITEEHGFREKINEILDGRKIKKIRIFFQSPDLSNEVPVFIYEALSYIFEIAQKKKLPIYSLPLTSDLTENKKRLSLFFIHEVHTDKDEIEKSKAYEFSGNITQWDPVNFRYQCASGAVLLMLRRQKEKEHNNIALPENIRQWQNDPLSAFERLNEKWKTDLLSTIRENNSLVKWWGLIRRFGAGRRGYKNLSRVLNPEFNENLFQSISSENQSALRDLNLLLPPIEHPPSELLNEIREVRRLLPTFYYPEMSSLEDMRSLNFEESHEYFIPLHVHSWQSNNQTFLYIIPVPLHTPLWESRLQTVLTRLYALIDDINSQLSEQDHPTSERRRIRSRLRRDISSRLGEIRVLLTGLIDEELREVINTENLFGLSPDRFRDAYIASYIKILDPIVHLFNLLWGFRNLPQWLPSLIYPVRIPVRHAIGLLRQAVRLLNFYQMICIALMKYQNMIGSFFNELSDLVVELQGYRKQTDNITKELEISAGRKRSIKFDYEDIDIKGIKRSPDNFPQNAFIIDEFEKSFQDKLKDIDVLTTASRVSPEEQERSSPPNVFVPAYFHKREAWNVKNEIIETVRRDKDFEHKFSAFISKHGLSPKTKEPYYTISKLTILIPAKNAYMKKWKKKALESSNMPLTTDMLKPCPENIRDDIEFIIGRGLDAKFWRYAEDSRSLGLTEEVYKWSSETIRTVFFQSSQGLTREEMRRLNGAQAEELQRWFLWFARKSFPENSENVEKFKNNSPEEIFGEMMNDATQTDPPHHDFYGEFIKPDGSCFMLRDTYSPELMNVFKAKNRRDCKLRLFTKSQIRTCLSKERILKELLGLFYNYALVKDLEEVINEFVERGLFSHQDKVVS